MDDVQFRHVPLWQMFFCFPLWLLTGAPWYGIPRLSWSHQCTSSQSCIKPCLHWIQVLCIFWRRWTWHYFWTTSTAYTPQSSSTCSWRWKEAFVFWRHFWQERKMTGLISKSAESLHTQTNTCTTLHHPQHVKRGVKSCLIGHARTVTIGENVRKDVKHVTEVLKANGYLVHIKVST